MVLRTVVRTVVGMVEPMGTGWYAVMAQLLATGLWALLIVTWFYAVVVVVRAVG